MMKPSEVLKREQAKAKRDELVERLLFDMRAYKIPEPVKEWPFAAKIGRRWKVDLAYPSHAPPIAIEVEGGQWVKSRHRTGTGFAADMDKYNRLALMGWLLLRFTTSHVTEGTAVPVIAEALGVALKEA